MSHRITRREALVVGAWAGTGLTLASLLRAEQGAPRRTRRSVVNIHLDGGPPQMDMIDPKPLAPAEIRGEFLPIETAVPGIAISELMPQVAASAGRFAFIRTLVGSAGQHDAFQCQSGFDAQELKSLGGRPAVGCVVSKLFGQVSDPAPAFVDLMQGRPLVRNSSRPGFLGPTYQAFRPDISQMFERELEAGMKGELARRGSDHMLRLTLDERLTPDRLGDRQALLAGFDRVRREIDANGMMGAMDRFQEQAAGILTSGQLAMAMDLTREDPRIVARYTAAEPLSGQQGRTSEGTQAPLKLLLARRLIEAGVRIVSVSLSDFDTHTDNFSRMRHLVPTVDHALATFTADLSERGMLDDVVLVVWGEFGRTPRINSKAGRDHWPRVGPCLLAGGGLRTGQVIGETDRDAGSPRNRPVTYKDVFATIYNRLGIDPRGVTLTDPQGRPQYLLDEGEPLRELVSS